MSIFEQLKRTNISSDYRKPGGKVPELYFSIIFDEKGAYLIAQDQKGKEQEIDYRQYSGVLRSVAKSIEQLQNRNNFTIDWENPDKRIYLHEHPYLLPQLLESGRLVNDLQQTITAGAETGLLKLVLQPINEKTVSAQVLLQTNNEEHSDFTYVNEEHALLVKNNTIVEVPPVGAYFHSLSNFNQPQLPLSMLQKYLSLLYSYVDEITLQHEGYTVKREAQPVNAQPALIFEKVDADNSLYLRIGQLMPNTDVDFLDEYDLFRFATINEMEQTILVRPIEQLPLDNYVFEVEKAAAKYAEKGRKKQDNGIIREDNLLILPQNVASEFIYKEIPALLADYALIGAEKLKGYKINIHPPKLNVQLGHGIDFLEGNATLDFGGQHISLLDAMSQFNKSRYIVLSDGSRALINEAYMQKLQRLFKKKKDNVAISFFDLPLVEELIEEKVAKEQFGQARSIFEGFNQLAAKKDKLPKINASLRPYQQHGYKWLNYLHEQKLGGCLADDMGLGKTLQTITLLAGVYGTGKVKKSSIVVMPKSLLFNWEKELQRFAPQLSYYIWYSSNRDIKDALEAQIILTTYAMLRNDIEQWKEQEFHYVILDESQAIKNMQSQLYKAVMLLNAPHRLALSGTPVENNLSELFALFRFLNPAMFGSSESFSQQYLTPIQKHNDKDATDELRRKIYPFILRRLKKDVLKELPAKIEQTLYVEMSTEQARYYESRRLFYKQAIEQQVASKGIQQAQFFIFQAMNELRQIASVPESQTDGRIVSPKTELLMEQLEDAVANNHKVLVFANYLAAVEQIGEELNKRQIDFVSMTGATNNRQQLVNKFQNDPNCRVFVLTLKTGGTGLNLTAADMVFIFDPWWNKAAENQAIDRAHRIGQQKTVLSYKLITLGSIEEKILQLQQAKSALFENLISSDGASIKSMSEDDISFILG